MQNVCRVILLKRLQSHVVGHHDTIIHNAAYINTYSAQALHHIVH